MKQALQALLISPDPVQRIVCMTGEKAITIREGHRDYKNGPVMICCHIDPWCVMAEIKSVRQTIASEVTEEEYTDDGFESREEMLRGLQSYYPEMTMESSVTVIRWKNVTGYWTVPKNIFKYAAEHNLFI